MPLLVLFSIKYLDLNLIIFNEAENGLFKSQIVSLLGPAKVNKVKSFSGSYYIIKRIPPLVLGALKLA